MNFSDPTYPLFTVACFLGFVVSIIPLSWHLQAWNAGTCAYMLWTGIACLMHFVNSLVWHGNIRNPAPIWCDISSKFTLGAGVGIAASTLCISRRLYSIASANTVSLSHQDKRRAVFIDLAISVGMPVLVMILHVVVQGHRFDILEDVGCFAVIYHTLPAYFLVFMWPTLLGVISFVYSGLTLRAFYLRRLQFAQLASAHSSMNVSRYLRLMALAMCDMAINVPVGIATVYISNKEVPLFPWISWEETHYNFSRVALVRSVLWRSNPTFHTAVELSRWIFPVSAFIFFALFGFATEARKQYSNAFWFMVKPFGLKPQVRQIKSKASVLPSWRKEVSDVSKSVLQPCKKAATTSTSDSTVFSISLHSATNYTNETDAESERTLQTSPTSNTNNTVVYEAWSPSTSTWTSKRYSSPY